MVHCLRQGDDTTDRILVVVVYQPELLQTDEQDPNQTPRQDDDAKAIGNYGEQVIC